MPLYEYRCEACGEQFEVIRKFSDPPLEVCARCGKGPIERLQSSPAIQFKGAGWYITDYARKTPAAEGSAEKADSKAKTESSDKSDTKSDKSDAKGADSSSAPAKTDSSSQGTPTTPAANKN